MAVDRALESGDRFLDGSGVASLVVSTVRSRAASDDALLFDGNWADIVSEAEAAGRAVAGLFEARGELTDLGRTVRVEVEVGPPGSPLVAWLLCTGRARCSSSGMAVVPTDVEIPDADWATALQMPAAYGEAFCAVLTEEAGAMAVSHVVLAAEPIDVPEPRQRTRATSAEPRL
ncbi:hypothetical protein LZ318_31165 [Saccharopolyspora indica]|uniref:hypothetical protein n=1 Tax=Saccharopolyspora indica TaxID=1229659 RepID=UPI0022EA1672|nr:hypothetical protein [Saccharopolyspora indica]MDA3644305.1 hypothetical protein [Saccharopolyspora indica]